ncbi:MAG: hypothetical protein JSV90_00310 [Methanobacteriota archaeon]|nr:MAG: hypothetical protein JSV90_00310 [Euryarchaeota archaeon]
MRSSILRLHYTLFEEYGDLGWWPADGPFEVAVGAILTQNTSWNNVETAIESLKSEGALCPSRIAAMNMTELESLVRPSGFFRQKARYLKQLASHIEREYSGDITAMSSLPMERVRAELLSLRGVGPETADTIMLYALRMPSFVVDAYTVRLLRRLGICDGDSHASIKAAFEEALDRDIAKLANAHAMIVDHCKSVCRPTPRCVLCPLREMCSEAEKQEERVSD